MNKYVISIKKDHDDDGNFLWNGLEHYPVYAFDDDLSFSKPYFSKYFAKEFESIEEAEEWFGWARPYLSDYIEKYCDMQTLSIQKEVTRYETVQEIKF